MARGLGMRDKEITFMKQGIKVTEAKLLGRLRAAVEAYEELDEIEGVIVDGTDQFEVYEDPAIEGVYAIRHKYELAEEGDEGLSSESIYLDFLIAKLDKDASVETIAKGLTECEFMSWPPKQTDEEITSFAVIF